MAGKISIAVLSLVVAVCTFYTLIYPGMTLTVEKMDAPQELEAGRMHRLSDGAYPAATPSDMTEEKIPVIMPDILHETVNEADSDLTEYLRTHTATPSNMEEGNGSGGFHINKEDLLAEGETRLRKKTWQDGTVSVKAEYSEEAGIPSNARLKVERLDKETDPELFGLREEELRELSGEAHAAMCELLEIGLWADGEKLVPEEQVAITVTFLEEDAEGTEGEILSIQYAGGPEEDSPEMQELPEGSVFLPDSTAWLMTETEPGTDGQNHPTVLFLTDELSSFGFGRTEIPVQKIWEDGEMTVTAEYYADAGIPENAELIVEKITPENNPEDYTAREESALKLFEGQDTTVQALLDIHLEADGVEVEPESPVCIRVGFTPVNDNVPAGSQVRVLHFAETEKLVRQGRMDPAAAALMPDQEQTGQHSGEIIEILDGSEIVEAESGMAKTAFEAATFSKYMLLTAAGSGENTITIKTGDQNQITVADENLEGRIQADFRWSSRDDGIVQITGGDGTKSVTIQGVSEGITNITLTYSYGDKKNKLNDTGTVTYQVRVTGAETGNDAEAEELENRTAVDGFSVRVRNTGSAKKLLKSYTLKVEELPGASEDYAAYQEQLKADTEETSFDFLKMYHIWLADKNGNEVAFEDQNADLEIVLTYDSAPAGWPEDGSLLIGHYGKKGAAIENRGVSRNTGGASAKHGKIKAEGYSLTFYIPNFSVITVAAPKTSPGETGSYSYNYQENSILSESTVQNAVGAANQWQIVSGQYENNDVSNKTVASNKRVRVQKNVIPTDTENEFLMYLSVDINRESIIQEYFEGAGFVYTPSNPIKEYGEYWPSGDAEKADNAWNSNGDDGNMRSFHIVNTGDKNSRYYWTLRITAGGKTYIIHRYASSGSFSNGHLVMKIGNGWMTVGDAAKTSGSNYVININITDEVLAKILTEITNVEIGTVVDQMGPGVTATEILSHKPVNSSSTTGNSAVISNAGKTITWHMVASTMGYTSDGWYPNIAELVYRIKYDPTVSNGLIQSDGTPVSNPETQVSTNASAALTYKVTTGNGSSTATQDFPSPVIRGLLYELKIAKKDQNGGLIKTDGSVIINGAQFGLYTDEACTEEKRISTGNVDENGYADFGNLPYGTYYLKELSPPQTASGTEYRYLADTERVYEYRLCYTDSSTVLQGQGANEEALYKDSTESLLPEIINEKVTDLNFKKYGYDGFNEAALAGAGFVLKAEDGPEAGKYYRNAGGAVSWTDTQADATVLTSGADGSFQAAGIPAGNTNVTYTLTETSVPDGYIKIEDVAVTIDQDGKVTSPTTADTGAVSLAADRETVEIVNEAKGSLKVTKRTLNNDTASEFAIAVTLQDRNGAGLSGEYDAALNGSPLKVTFTEGTMTDPAALSLKKDGTLVISGLPAGATASVSETLTEDQKKLYMEPTIRQRGFERTNGTIRLKSSYEAGSEVTVAKSSDPAELEITNKPKNVDISIVKTDNGDLAHRLSGAEFTLKQTSAGANQGKYYSLSGSDPVWVSEAAGLTTGTDGALQLKGIPEGSYELREIKAPDGYQLPAAAWTITVENGSVTAFSGPLTVQKVTDGDYAGMYNVPNNQGAMLPTTGGPGGTAVNWYLFGAMLLIAAAFVGAYELKRELERRLQ
ncbi:MAG: hypothetical protein IJ061_09755 [Lachnospiraceae bacterium]|nr:hypothetical protein [Lachnospiraceae bacterium]